MKKNSSKLLITSIMMSSILLSSFSNSPNQVSINSIFEPMEVFANNSSEIEVEFNGYKVLFDTSKGEIVRYVSGSGPLIIPSEINGVQVKSIGYRAFRPDKDHFNNETSPEDKEKLQSISHVYIPEGVTYIGEGAFCFNFSLNSIYLPSTLTKIGETVSSFYMCISLENVYYGGTQEQWQNINIIDAYLEKDSMFYSAGDTYNQYLYNANRNYNSNGIEISESFLNSDSCPYFSDVKTGAEYYKGLEYLYNNNIINGTSDTTFSPNDTMNRAMLVTMLHRIEGEPTAMPSDFIDVEEDQWYTNAINWAKETGLVNGTSDTTFSPNESLTKEQVVAIIDRYYEYKEYNLDKIKEDNPKDLDNASDWFKLNINNMYQIGILNTDFDNNFNPTSKATRGDVAYMLGEFLIKLNINK